jgi:hypothetical protein
MTKKTINRRFMRHNLQLISAINQIIADRKKLKERITIRKINDDLFAKGLLSNTLRDYKNLVQLVSNARSAGLIAWDAIEGRKQLKETEK